MSSPTNITRSLAASPFVDFRPYSDSERTTFYIDLTFKTEGDLTSFAALVNKVKENCFQVISSSKGKIALPAEGLRLSLVLILTACPSLEKRLSQVVETIKCCRATA